MASVRRQERGQRQAFGCLTLQTLNGGSKAPPAPGAFQPWPSGIWAGQDIKPQQARGLSVHPELQKCVAGVEQPPARPPDTSRPC